MALITGHPALRLLARLRFVGMLRRQARRFRTPAGAVFALVGVGMIGLWLTSLLVAPLLANRTGLPSSHADERIVRLVAGVLFTLTVAGSLTHRGLYLPQEEIERLFSSPIPRRDVVRYRLVAGMGRSLFGAVFFALVVTTRVPRPVFGFCGTLVAMLTLPILGQGASLLAGDAENRVQRLLRKLPLRFVQLGSGLLVAAILIIGMQGDNVSSTLSGLGLDAGLDRLLELPLVRYGTALFAPWSTAITAETGATFLRGLLLSVAVLLAAFEAVSRIGVDYRELSLQTSADVARRITRLRRGGMATGSATVSKRIAGWRVPWILGRGPAGAVAWRKTAGILRKARGTLLTGGLIVALLTAVSIFVTQGTGGEGLIEGLAIVVIGGTLYLTAGLRFDFREDLEVMETILAWPVRPRRLFVATLLPEVLLVSGLVTMGVCARSAVVGAWHPWTPAILVPLPAVIFVWVAVDNIVFLHLPVRSVPGQEGLLGHAGRHMVLMLVRGLLMMLAAAAAALGAGAVLLLDEWLSLSTTVRVALVLGAVALSLAVECLLLSIYGGRALRRFDVARDRPA